MLSVVFHTGSVKRNQPIGCLRQRHGAAVGGGGAAMTAQRGRQASPVSYNSWLLLSRIFKVLPEAVLR